MLRLTVFVLYFLFQREAAARMVDGGTVFRDCGLHLLLPGPDCHRGSSPQIPHGEDTQVRVAVCRTGICVQITHRCV